jgi:hypothetical protein
MADPAAEIREMVAHTFNELATNFFHQSDEMEAIAEQKDSEHQPEAAAYSRGASAALRAVARSLARPA